MMSEIVVFFYLWQQYIIHDKASLGYWLLLTVRFLVFKLFDWLIDA